MQGCATGRCRGAHRQQGRRQACVPQLLKTASASPDSSPWGVGAGFLTGMVDRTTLVLVAQVKACRTTLTSRCCIALFAARLCSNLSMFMFKQQLALGDRYGMHVTERILLPALNQIP
jgi:hypothetical protein